MPTKYRAAIIGADGQRLTIPLKERQHPLEIV